jgi:hypothetical protein
MSLRFSRIISLDCRVLCLSYTTRFLTGDVCFPLSFFLLPFPTIFKMFGRTKTKFMGNVY